MLEMLMPLLFHYAPPFFISFRFTPRRHRLYIYAFTPRHAADTMIFASHALIRRFDTPLLPLSIIISPC